MWRFKPFMHKEQAGLEGRVIDIGNYKVQIRNPIAEGGFSCVYVARDALHGSKQYALKHIICNDGESQELVMKEISIMKTLKGHPNVVILHAHATFDMGRTKETFLLMEYCEKSLVNVLENRGAGFFEEKRVLEIFRDICNAVFAMHCQKPPIAHRDLKAENILLGSDGQWKLCDFGSTSTNHKRFEKPEEMGIEEDNIRKHTTPAYRAPEMWDLFRREVINEKVDIWALGCLLFRISYLKSAFDGESKLQILNGNYRIPDLPKYDALLTELIRDMLQSSPDDRPDIMQVWFRVNGLLPDGMQKSLPDTPPEMLQHSADVIAAMSNPEKKSSPMPRRSPPPPPYEASRNVSPGLNISKDSTAPLGAFWATQHAKDSEVGENKSRPKYDEDTTNHKSSASHITAQKDASVNRPSGGPTKDLNLFTDNSSHSPERLKQHKPEVAKNDTYNDFIAVFDSADQKPLEKEGNLESEVEKLKDQLARVITEKTEITSKCEKLSAICRSQRQEIQNLKTALASRTPSPSRESLSSANVQNEKIEGSVWELQQGFFDQQWQAFADPSANNNTWGFDNDTFKVAPTTSSKINIASSGAELDSSRRFGGSQSTGNKVESQPSGWAGF